MRNCVHLWMVAMATLVSLSATAGEKVTLYPLELVGIEDTTAVAIQRSLADELQARGLVVLKGEDTVPTSEASATPQAGEASEASPPTDEAAPETSEKNKTAPTPTAGETPAAADAPPVHPETVPPRADRTREMGARYYITGSIVRLGNQTTVSLELNHTDGGIVSAKKVVARNDGELPRAVQTIAGHMAQDINRHVATAPRPAPTPKAQGAARTDGEAPPAAPHPNVKFEKNFGLSISQAFSLKDEMYSFTSFNFNGRFEFNQLLLIVTAGFAMGNRNFEDGFHFNLDISLAAYLTKGQVSPYIGGGLGLFIGNKLDTCSNEDDSDYYYDSRCTDDSIVGWEVFPVVGVEMLRSYPIRLHVEARYLVAFNAFLDWGHGPMMVLGVAF